MKQSKRKRENAVPANAEQPIADAIPSSAAAIDESAAMITAASAPEVKPELKAVPAPKEKSVSEADQSKSVALQTHMYALNANCTVRDGVELKSALLDLIGDSQPVTIDVRAVERIDTAALQLLCAFVRDRRAAGGVVNWICGAESFSEAVRLLGLADVLGISRDMLQGASA